MLLSSALVVSENLGDSTHQAGVKRASVSNCNH